MKQKDVFKLIFVFLAVTMAILPFLVSFNDILTRLVEQLGFYMWIQRIVIPWEIRMVGLLVRPLGINFIAQPSGMTINGTYAALSWNCIGWQSLLLLIITLVVGLRGNYTRRSQLETVVIGLLGTFLINLLRVVLTVVLLSVSQPLFAVVFHDYLAAIVTVVWLSFFWWFSYAFVLEVRRD